MMTQPITVEHLSRFSLFKSIADEALQEIAPHCHMLIVESGETLFEQDDPAEHLYLVLTGSVALIRKYDDGEVVLATVGPEEVIGELSMIVQEPRTASGVALEPTELVVLDRDQLVEYLNKYPGVSFELMHHMAHRLRDATLKLREWSLENADARIASLILFLAQEDGRIKTGLVTSTTRPRTLARGAGVSADYLNEVMERWSDEGYVGVDGRRILLHDEKALMTIAGWNK